MLQQNAVLWRRVAGTSPRRRRHAAPDPPRAPAWLPAERHAPDADLAFLSHHSDRNAARVFAGLVRRAVRLRAGRPL